MQVQQRRSKGFGTLQKQGRVYYARWVYGGKVYKRSTHTGNLGKAEGKLKEYTAPFRLGTEAQIIETIGARLEGIKADIQKHEDDQPKLTLSQAWAAYLKSPNRPDSSQDTLDHYEQQFSRFLKWAKAKHPKTVELRDFTEEQAAAES